MIVEGINNIIQSILERHDLFQNGFLHSYWNPDKGIDDSQSNYFYIRQLERRVNPTYTFTHDEDTNAYDIGAEFYLVADITGVDEKQAIEILVSHLERCTPGVGVLGVDDDPYFIFNQETQFLIDGGGLLTNPLPLIRIRFQLYEPFRIGCKEILCKAC